MENSFLKLVAHDLYDKYGYDLSKVAVVFPNKRASLFFNQRLAKESDTPIWSPTYYSIADLFAEISSLEVGDNIKLVCELYKVFIEETQSEESLDDFYFWGELLLNDFDDIDKNMVDANKLFVNLRDLKELSNDFTFLSPEQEEAIQQFFQNFSIEKRTLLKERFLSLWEALGGIYQKYKECLLKQEIAYEGLMYRIAIEELDIDNLPYDTYAFVGFNVLNKVENQFFRKLKDAGKAIFYWDYDRFYMDKENHEASEFIRKNLMEFPSRIPKKAFEMLIQKKNVRYVAASTENAQARYLPEWLKDNISEKEEYTGIILCNENLLLSVLHSIPSEIKDLNVTLGFPLTQTPVYSLINSLLDLQTIGYREEKGRFIYKYVTRVLKHAYTRQLSPEAELLEQQLSLNNRFYPYPSELKRDDFLKVIFTPQSGNLAVCNYLIEVIQLIAGFYKETNNYEDIYTHLYVESLFKAYTTISRFKLLVEEGELIINTDNFRRLLTRVLSGINTPFQGEPLIGLQIMGMLETRNIDFKNVILLSTNEGKLPKSGGESSFIPYNLRKAYGMSTLEHRNSLYAYYFYRLLQRAENITLVYNTSMDGLNRGEWSRYMLQFLMEWPHEIKREYLEAGQSPQSASKIIIEKTPELLKRLQNRFDIRVNPRSQFSPSALNVYLDCQLKFYFHYVAELEPLQEVTTDIDSPTFGSIFHQAAEWIYKELTVNGKLIRKEDIQQLLKNEQKLKGYVDSAFKKLFFNVSDEEKPEYNGIQLINSEVIFSYLKQLLRNDLYYAPFQMEAMEKKVYEEIEIPTSKGVIKTKIGGMIDRMDSKNGILRIVDYKTGGSPKTFTDIESLFVCAENRPNYIFQTFLYASIMVKKQPFKVAPALLYIHRAASEEYSPIIEMGGGSQKKTPIEDFSLLEEEFRERLMKLLGEIFDSSLQFHQTELLKVCEYCNFKVLCKRGV